jgi:sensor histidine kinase regulating citrate/malate metabolism
MDMKDSAKLIKAMEALVKELQGIRQDVKDMHDLQHETVRTLHVIEEYGVGPR